MFYIVTICVVGSLGTLKQKKANVTWGQCMQPDRQFKSIASPPGLQNGAVFYEKNICNPVSRHENNIKVCS